LLPGFLTLDAPPIIPVMLIAIGVVLVASAAIRRATTELAVTSKRVIAKTGLISRKTVELNLEAV
jgi:uncharacterized membrane protein YdbT with pleckstrin-like domain